MAPLGFVHAKVVDIQHLPVPKHRVVLGDLQNAECVACHLALVQGDENRAVRIFQQRFQGGLIIFLSAGAEQIRANLMVYFSNLLQKVQHTGNVPALGKTNFHGISSIL